MMAREMEKAFSPDLFEQKVYQRSLERGDFTAASSCARHPFSIVMPPPNVTGVLHMGHALNMTMQDIIVRYNRMIGRNVLWLPGTDHAGIATQHVMEVELQKEGKKRTDLTREEFVARTSQLKDRHHDIIVSQIKRMGASCDWSRERFTLDEGFCAAVREAFCVLYERGLAYRDEYLVNYCPHCRTAISDDEVEFKSVGAFLYYINYPVEGSQDVLTVATTRPETLFADSAVAVHPEDERFKGFVGKMLALPLTDRRIPVIADGELVKKDVGTGAVKVTPAHDFKDYRCAARHGLGLMNMLNPDGTLNENAPERYRGLDCRTAREIVVKDLEKQGFLVKTESITHDVGHCYRCGTVIEPYMSRQWFIRMDTMAKKALKALDDGEIVFHPGKWASTYRNWMENIRPWCISRQLWWGHRIPAWYCADCGKTIVSRDDPSHCPFCRSVNISQDPDVLDTWFSSWLWPFATMGWPHESEDLKTFYPTTALVTAYDIIFFWVSRMIMAGLEFTGKAPFKDIYITALVRDRKGRKMSKSLGNGIDPIQAISAYGSDAMRFTLAYQAAQGQDVLIDMDSFKFGSKFANKLWNASRFILMNLDGTESVRVDDMHLNDYDKWILHKLNMAISKTHQAYAQYKINEAMWAVYDFFWNDFCDWHIEFSKSGIQSGDLRLKSKTASLSLFLLDAVLKLAHPAMPLITEEIFSRLPDSSGTLASSRYPEGVDVPGAEESSVRVETLKDVIRAIRNLRAAIGIGEGGRCDCVLTADGREAADFLFEQAGVISSFCGASSLSFEKGRDSSCVYSVGNGFMVGIRKPDGFDASKKVLETQRQIAKTKADLDKCLLKLSNENFLGKANLQAVEKERSKKAEFEERIAKLQKTLSVLQE